MLIAITCDKQTAWKAPRFNKEDCNVVCFLFVLELLVFILLPMFMCLWHVCTAQCVDV
jgi:hypothetical protein